MQGLFTALRKLTLGLSLVLAVTAQADEQTQKTGSIRADVFAVLEKVQQAQEAGNIQQALELLDTLKARHGKKALQPYEAAQLWNFYAYAYLAQENFSAAIEAFKKVLDQPELPAALKSGTQFTLAQLYFSEGDIKTAVSLLESWFKQAENPGPDAYVLLGQGYLQLQRLDDALNTLLKAFAVAKAQGKEEKENWYALLQYVYAEKNNLPKQEEVLEVLVSRWPKTSYWMALIGVYAEQGKEDLQLYAMETAYVQGMLEREPYLVSLAQLLAANGAPYKAANVMEKGFKEKNIEENAKNLERTGEYWRRAQEIKDALPRLQAAAAQADDGESAVRLAYLYMSLHQYSDAVAQLQLGLQKGKLRQPLQSRFLLGQAQFHARQYDAARKTFEKLVADTRQDEKQQRLVKQVSEWLRYMENEIQRQKDIKAYLG